MTQRERLQAAYKLLDGNSTTFDKFDSIRNLVKGINSTLDKHLDDASITLSQLKEIYDGEVIELSVESLLENTDEEKRRKKLLLLFIKNFKSLKNEIKRMSMELDNLESKNKIQRIKSASKIATFAKGPFGLITIAAIIIAGVTFFVQKQSKTSATISPTTMPQLDEPAKNKERVLDFNGKKIPLSELAIRNGPDCDLPHYHALDHVSVKTINGEIIQDPGACAFGRVKDVKITEIIP